jgi:hypothetical protein
MHASEQTIERTFWTYLWVFVGFCAAAAIAVYMVVPETVLMYIEGGHRTAGIYKIVPKIKILVHVLPYLGALLIAGFYSKKIGAFFNKHKDMRVDLMIRRFFGDTTLTNIDGAAYYTMLVRVAILTSAFYNLCWVLGNSVVWLNLVPIQRNVLLVIGVISFTVTGVFMLRFFRKKLYA